MLSDKIKPGNISVLFGIISVAVIAFFAFSLLKGENILKDAITEEVLIFDRLNGKCIVDTNDDIMTSKMIDNCESVIGKNVTITYQKGHPTAQIIQ